LDLLFRKFKGPTSYLPFILRFRQRPSASVTWLADVAQISTLLGSLGLGK
jgi:hypothetical protein